MVAPLVLCGTMTITLGYKNIAPTPLFLERLQISVSVRERGRQRKMGDCYIDPYLLNYIVISYSEPNLALFCFLPWSLHPSTSAHLTLWLTVALWLCDWLSEEGTRVYIISQWPCISVVNPCELLTPMDQCLSVYTTGACRLWQRSICSTWTLMKSLQKKMRTLQGCCVLFWTNSGSSNPQSSSCMATCLPSYILS